MGLVWDLDLPSNEKFILLAYADHADHEGRNIYPAVATIARKTGYSERSVQSLTRSLQERGLLVEDGKGPKGTNKWRYASGGGAKFAPPSDGGVQDGAQGGANGTGEGVQPTAPEPSLTVKEPSSVLTPEELAQVNRKMDSMLQLSQAPGIKKIHRLNSILSYLGPALGINSETKRWKEFAEFVDERQQLHGERVEVFIGWVTSQPKFDIQFWPPSRMMELWPQAFRARVEAEKPRQKTELERFMEERRRNGN